MTPRKVGNYRLDSLLGSGGMGEVYKAHDTYRDRYVALKLLPEAFSDDREYLKRFQRESQVAARLREPHVIPIHDFGEIDGQLFIDLRLVDGDDIGALLNRDGRIAPPRAVYLISQVARALDAAHADLLVHRDIKPSNILVTFDDFVYVVDFGIARSAGGQQTALTITGATIGTLHYMAPERFAGHAVDGRADVYSLACVLHECLTGAPPFRGKDLPALLYAQLHVGPPPASRLVDGVPPALDAVIARGMAKDPEDRFQTAGSLAAAAREALLAQAPVPPMTELPTPAWTVLGGPTQTMFTGTIDNRGGTRPPENMPPGTGPDGSGLPPVVATDRSAREPDRRRLGVLILAAAAAIAAAVALVLIVSGRPNGGGVSATPSTGATGARTAAPTSSVPSIPASVTVPTVAEKIPVGQSPSYVQVAPNGKFAYVANPGAGAITVVNTVSDQVTGTVKIPQGPPQSVSFSPDSRTAYVSVYNGSNSVHLIAFIDTATGAVTATVPVNNHAPGPSTTSPDGRYLYVPNHNLALTGPDENVIDVIDTVSKKLVDSIPVAANPHWIVFGKNGRFYATNHLSTVITVLDASDNSVISEVEVGETPHSIAISPDGSRLAVTSYNGNEVYVVSTAADQEVARIPVGRLPLEVAYSPDGRYIYTVDNEDNAVTVIDAADNRVIGEVPTGKAPTSISVLPNGRQAYVTDENDGTIEVLNLTK
jgi:YVTN family beta-propeller protein